MTSNNDRKHKQDPSLREVFNVIAHHRRNLLKVNLITSALNVLYLIEEPLDVFLLEVGDKFSKEKFEAFVGDLVLSLVEEL